MEVPPLRSCGPPPSPRRPTKLPLHSLSPEMHISPRLR